MKKGWGGTTRSRRAITGAPAGLESIEAFLASGIRLHNVQQYDAAGLAVSGFNELL